MPKGYWIVRVDITDQERYKSYVPPTPSLGEVRRALSGASRVASKIPKAAVAFATR